MKQKRKPSDYTRFVDNLDELCEQYDLLDNRMPNIFLKPWTDEELDEIDKRANDKLLIHCFNSKMSKKEISDKFDSIVNELKKANKENK